MALKLSPLRSTSFGSFAPYPVSLFFSQSGRSQAEWQGGVIMTTLRALVGAYSMVVFMGFVVSVPFVWTIVLGIAATSTEKIVKSRPYQPNDELMQKKILPRTSYEQMRYKSVAKEK
jgi:hypothetical protein